MRPPAFWWGEPTHRAARLLAPAGRAYGAMTAARMDRPGLRAPCPVVCVGNFILGGAGKTPTAIRIAQILGDLGERPAFLTRGYGGRLPGPLVVNPALHDAGEVGDEPLLLARTAITVVARDRPAGARLCVARGASVVVMDDGLQNPSLHKHLALVVVDAGAGLGNGLPFPAGPLRVPLERQWRHVGGLVLIGEGERGERVAQDAIRLGLTVHRAHLVPDAPAAALCGRDVVAFAGIGRPDKFFDTLREIGAQIVGTRAFPDHHAYRESDFADLAAAADRSGAALVTTEKDFVRLGRSPFAARVTALPVNLRFADEAPLRESLRALRDRAR